MNTIKHYLFLNLTAFNYSLSQTAHLSAEYSVNKTTGKSFYTIVSVTIKKINNDVYGHTKKTLLNKFLTFKTFP